jgi:polyisoprenoid-binding protein YceI
MVLGDKKMKKPVIAVLMLIVLVASSYAQDLTKFELQSGDVLFISKAPLETFDGRTSMVSGDFSINPEMISNVISGKIVVDVQSLDTGKKLRNEHMMDGYLNPDQYPEIVFEPNRIVKAEPGSLADGEIVAITVAGDFLLHGVTKEVEATGNAMYNAEKKKLDVSFDFVIKLTDFGIKRPSFLLMKVSDEINVNVRFNAITE